ncbi:hypothetical protein MT325_m193L [Paramecium bursaria chlorella virus MT325]|uniref:Uncharacterized protein m193L n=1 Tax=Paramecium bursaria Chlorella virus MT325 TaxID=346932 RepID=A7ITS3_PBCVM|nr:hypothetical protein MT325_m193L [Paramecium bursaria chlorella virus MT325]
MVGGSENVSENIATKFQTCFGGDRPRISRFLIDINFLKLGLQRKDGSVETTADEWVGNLNGCLIPDNAVLCNAHSFFNVGGRQSSFCRHALTIHYGSRRHGITCLYKRVC